MPLRWTLIVTMPLESFSAAFVFAARATVFVTGDEEGAVSTAMAGLAGLAGLADLFDGETAAALEDGGVDWAGDLTA